MTEPPDGPTDRMEPARQAREFAWFAASTALYQGARFLFSLAAAKALSASGLSAWSLVVAVLAYAPAILVGVNNGMSRELPILIGRGAQSAIAGVLAAAWAATAFALTAIAIVVVAIATAAPAVRLESILVGMVIGGTIVFGVQQFVLRSRLRFDAASLQLGVFGGAMLVAAGWLALADRADLSTALALYAGPLTASVVLGAALELPAVRAVDRAEIRRLAGIGFPIMLAGLVFSLFVTLDRWVAVSLLGPERAAPYTLASLIAAAMLIVPTVVSQQTYPRMAMARGRGANVEQLLTMARRQGLAAAGLVLPVTAMLIAFASTFLSTFLPEYAAAGGAVIVLSIGFTVLAFLTGYGNYLNVVGLQWRYLGAQVAAALTALPLMVIGGSILGLTGIAAGMAASHVVYGLLLWFVATHPPDGLLRLDSHP